MLEKFVEFSTFKEINQNFVYSDDYELPKEVLFLMKKYPSTSFLDGFFFLVNHSDYSDILDEIYIPLNKPSICFARDAFGSLYVWENNSIKLVDVRHGKSEIIGRKPSVFFNLKMTDKGFLEKRMGMNKYIEAKSKIGHLAYDECYGYIPILAAGGSEKVENLQKVKIKEHIAIIAQLAGKIN